MPNDPIEGLLRLHEAAVADGRRRTLRRALFDRIVGEAGRHAIGIAGPRGAGKTILLRQIAAARADAFYLSADTLDPAVDLYALAEFLGARLGIRSLLLDELHFLRDGFGALKRIADFLPLRVVFTSSMALALKDSAYDLSRRVAVHDLDYFSFAEFMRFRYGREVPLLELGDLLEGRWSPEHMVAAGRFEEYLAGGLLPFSLEEPDPLPLLRNALATVVEKDVPQVLRLTVPEISAVRGVLEFVGKSGVDGINVTSVAANVGITKYKAAQYLRALESAFVLQCVLPAGTNVLREPKVLLVPPVRLLFRDAGEARGGLREDFFALAMRQAGIPFTYLKGTRGQKTPDFLLVHHGEKVALEVGGKGKGRSQFKGVAASRRIVLSHGSVPAPGRISLHLLGFLKAGSAGG